MPARGTLAVLAAVPALLALALAGVIAASAPPSPPVAATAPGRLTSAVLAASASRAATDAVAWCGSDESAADRKPDVEVSSAAQVHAVYVLPADGQDRFAELASPIATDVAAIADWWRREDYQRVPRFDLYPFPGCTSTYGQLDLEVVRLPQPADYYRAGGDSDEGFRRLTQDLAPSEDVEEKTLAFYDGPTGPRLCGQGWQSRLSGGAYGLAVVYLRADPLCGELGLGKDGAVTAVHELLHGLGAVPPEAPHNCPDSPGHACDHSGDIMRPWHTYGAPLSSYALDVNHDDYYAHAGDWPDVQDSRWLERLPQLPLSISVEERGGKGSITSSPEGISCPGTCSVSLDSGLEVMLFVAPESGSRFLGWSGACTGTDDCPLTMDGPKALTAVFGADSYELRVGAVGKGRVSSRPAGIACPGSCTRSFAADQLVRLTARPAKGQRLAGWKGACSGTRACSVRMDRDRSVRAVFAPLKKRR